MSVARLIADQMTKHAVPHAFTCRVHEVSESWFYKWIKDPTRRPAVLSQGEGELPERQCELSACVLCLSRSVS